MAETSHIEWTDATWNPITGCSVVSPGCTNCYAMKLAGTRLQHHPSRAGLTRWTKAGPVWSGEVRFNEQWLNQPLKWRRPRMIFVCAHGDLFHEDVPGEWIDRVFAVMALASQHTFQVLTKRAERMRAYLLSPCLPGRLARAILDLAIADPKRLKIEPWPVRSVGDIDDPDDVTVSLPLPNVWLGVSVEDQKRADERIPDLLATPAAVRFLSCEPLLGPVDLTYLDLAIVEAWEQEPSGLTRLDALNGIHSDGENGDIPGVWGDPDPHVAWVICGGESGPGARPMHPDWARNLRDQCASAGVPFFFKQWGAWGPDGVRYRTTGNAGQPGTFEKLASCGFAAMVAWTKDEGDLAKGDQIVLMGKKAAGRLLDGTTHDGMPRS